MTTPKDIVLKNLEAYGRKHGYLGAMPMLDKILELKCMIDGLSAEEVAKAIKELIADGYIYVCRVDKFYRKV